MLGMLGFTCMMMRLFRGICTKANPDYQNNRTTHAVANISRVYDDRLIKHDFLKEDEP